MWWIQNIGSLSGRFVEEFCESKWTHLPNHLNKHRKYRVLKTIAWYPHSHHNSFSGSKTTLQTLTITALPFPSKTSLWIQIAGSFFQHPMDKFSFSPQVFDLSPESPLQYQCSYFIPLQPIPYIHSHRPCITTAWDFLQTNYFISVSTIQPVSFAMILVSTTSSGSWLASSFQIPLQNNLTRMLHNFILSTLFREVSPKTLLLPLSSQRREGPLLPPPVTFYVLPIYSQYPLNIVFCLTSCTASCKLNSFKNHQCIY